MVYEFKIETRWAHAVQRHCSCSGKKHQCRRSTLLLLQLCQRGAASLFGFQKEPLNCCKASKFWFTALLSGQGCHWKFAFAGIHCCSRKGGRQCRHHFPSLPQADSVLQLPSRGQQLSTEVRVQSSQAHRSQSWCWVFSCPSERYSSQQSQPGD